MNCYKEGCDKDVVWCGEFKDDLWVSCCAEHAETFFDFALDEGVWMVMINVDLITFQRVVYA